MFRVVLLCSTTVVAAKIAADEPENNAKQLVKKHCFDCHGNGVAEGGLDLSGLMTEDSFDCTLAFENLITGKMPPADAVQPTASEKRGMLKWLAEYQTQVPAKPYRRISRYEFVHSVNDLLGINLDIAEAIPEDRGTNDFDSDRRIMLTKEMLNAYFNTADEMLEFAFPKSGFPHELIWMTSKLKDSHRTYNIYVQDYLDGQLFSWTRANNGNSYSFFYDNFDPPQKGWYELTFDAAKVGDFAEDVSVLVYAGKYYFADDRPQPQRLLDVISLGNKDVKSHTIRAFLHPGDNVSVHCYSRHTWRQQGGNQGAYIKQLRVRGPVLDQWPPMSYQKVFADLSLEMPHRKVRDVSPTTSVLAQIGGRMTVSSFQKGMEKEKMQDGSNKTFWHTRFTPDVAKPPHYVVLENPADEEINGLSYSTWSGGNGNGQVKAYKVLVSDDGNTWSGPIVEGTLEVRLAAEQEILFPAKTRKPFIKFLVTDAISLDGKSLASIGKLDVLTHVSTEKQTAKLSVLSAEDGDLLRVIKRFAEHAFSSTLTDDEMAPYVRLSLDSLEQHDDFIAAAKEGLKAIICSPRFLLAPGAHQNDSQRMAAELARTLWLSVPDQRLLDLSKADGLSGETIATEIDRMLNDEKASRMIQSFCAQWLNLRSFNKVSPSLKLYPSYNDLLNHYLPLETEGYLSHLICENLPANSLIDSDFSILNQRLAQHYGIDGVVGQRMRKVSFTSENPRGGLLTMGSVLKVTSDGFDTSPILRGAWISKNIVGNTLSPPPESVKAIEPSVAAKASIKEQIEQHKNSDACIACHKSIDPYGVALENFDATGQWRTRYRVQKPHPGTFIYRQQGYYELANEVDASSQIGESSFEDVVGLKKILLGKQQKVAYNFAKKFFEYANGYKPTLQQRIVLYDMVSSAAEECRLRDLIIDVLMYSFAGESR